MADATLAPIVTLVQPCRPLTGAERQARYRQRLKERKTAVTPPSPAVIGPKIVGTDNFAPARLALRLAAFGLAAVGIVQNGMFAMSLGSTDRSEWLFLALGLASDCAALALPSVAAGLWQRGERGSAVTGWFAWATVFAFALLSGLGFASTSITDVTLSRASRVTPAVTQAQVALTDAMKSRDAECHGGVGKFCRTREDAVQSARAGLEAAMGSVATSADPQTQAAVHLVAWITGGAVRPSGDDFAMVRLLLLTMLPQIGGVLLTIGRAA
jgi:hypothetical protein